ncbi:hypothetical protein lerEdw1_006595 [Lerista edwardsae]|nr:hypothetical protein lerEdw1_006595 [Lerista edwardsae]
MEAAGIADWSEMAQDLRHAGARVNGYAGFANGRRGLAFGSRQQPSEEDEQREDDAPWPATGGKDRGREGTAQEASNENPHLDTPSHLKTESDAKELRVLSTRGMSEPASKAQECLPGTPSLSRDHDSPLIAYARDPDRTLTMMAESLPFCMSMPVSTWELEEWYEDLQEVLSLDVTSKIVPPEGGQEQKAFDEIDDSALLWSLETPTPLQPSGSEADGICELDSNVTAELLELLEEEPTRPPESDSSHSSPAQTGTDDDEAVSTSRKRKQSGQPQGGKRQRGREREQENERRVAELMAHNQQLQEEIKRLSAEVETTRAALIQRMVSLKT